MAADGDFSVAGRHDDQEEGGGDSCSNTGSRHAQRAGAADRRSLLMLARKKDSADRNAGSGLSRRADRYWLAVMSFWRGSKLYSPRPWPWPAASDSHSDSILMFRIFAPK